MRPGAAAVPALLLLCAVGAPAQDRSEHLEQVREAIASSRDRVGHYEREERGLLEALEAIEHSAALLRRHVARAREEADVARSALAHAEAASKGLAADLARTERAMGQRAAALYKTGEVGALPVLFSSTDLREFLVRVQTLRLLLGHDAALLARHRAQSEALEASRLRAAEAARETEAAERALAERSDQLRTERARKARLMAHLRSSRTRERAALRELETAAQALELAVTSLPAGATETTVAGGPAFASLRGRLAAPVRGRVRSGFGRVVDGEFKTETFRKGIEFEASRGAAVNAVAAGRVRFAGPFRGYGNTVILEHGEQYFTVSSHLDRVDVAVGDAIASGQQVGVVGETGSLSGPHLYFEVRRGAEPLDPRRWLRSGGAARRAR